MKHRVKVALQCYLGTTDPESYTVPAWWARKMEETGLYKPGMVSAYDSDFAIGIGSKRTPVIVRAVEWLDKMDVPWLALIGSKGVGKTYLAKILGVLWMTKTKTLAKHVKWAPWLNQQRARIGQSVAGKDVSEEPDIASLYHVPFLIVDDLSTGRVGASTWALETLFALMEARTDRPTVFVSNAPLADRIDENSGKRLFSPYRRQLLTQANKANGDRIIYLDLVEKVCDRFSQGLGSEALHLLVQSITGDSYRVLV